VPKGPGAEISGQVYVDGAIVETPAQVGETSRATHAHYCVYLVGTHSIAITSHTCEAAPLERVSRHTHAKPRRLNVYHVTHMRSRAAWTCPRPRARRVRPSRWPSLV